VTPQAIRRANNLPDANLIRVGQELIIPPAS
jgi:LysM repeat protein